MAIMQPQQEPDYSDLQRATTELSRLTARLAGLSEGVADAKTVKEFDSERRKSAFSRSVMRAYKAGAESVSKAEHMARDDEKYNAELKTLREHYAAAEKALTDFQILMIQIDAMRSLVSAQRAMSAI